MIDKLIAGDALDFDTTVVDSAGNQYTPADGWAMTLRLAPRSSGTPIDISTTASDDNQGFAVEVSSATTANWAAGNYSAFALVTLSGERKTVHIGEVEILADPATATAFDVRTHARKVLEAIEAVLENRATTDQQSMTINGRSLERIPVQELIKMRQVYQSEAAREESAARLASGLAPKNRIFVRR